MTTEQQIHTARRGLYKYFEIDKPNIIVQMFAVKHFLSLRVSHVYPHEVGTEWAESLRKSQEKLSLEAKSLFK